jgi:hypothetical protein
MLTAGRLMKLLAGVPRDMEIRIGDVSEQDDLHCSVGRVIRRSGCVVLDPGDDDVWRDETLSSEILAENLWPEEKEE